jgi:hypothetical protein
VFLIYRFLPAEALALDIITSPSELILNFSDPPKSKISGLTKVVELGTFRCHPPPYASNPILADADVPLLWFETDILVRLSLSA